MARALPLHVGSLRWPQTLSRLPLSKLRLRPLIWATVDDLRVSVCLHEDKLGLVLPVLPLLEA